MPTADYRFLREMQGRPIVDKRRGDRHKKRKRTTTKTPSHVKTKWERRLIVAWDGEGANLQDGTHVYNLLANSDGVRILNHSGLGTSEILDFFITYGNPRAINCIYGGSYDINMLLVDLPDDKLAQLWVEGSCYWQDYRIFYASRKKFTVQKYYQLPNGRIKRASFTLWDVLGFFQSTFVTACRKWLGNLPILDSIEHMKSERSVFNVDRIEEIIDYNQKECTLLVMLMEALFESLDTAGIKLTRYDGAGAIASALLKKHSVSLHRGLPNPEVVRWAQYAYSGGRIEACKVGNYETLDEGIGQGRTYPLVHRYDINSAYPSILLNLPSYKDAVWDFSKEWDGSDNSMVHVKWAIEDEQPFYPLWYREHDGTILYPRWGEGIYWGSEVRNLTENYPGQYEIVDACNVFLQSEDKPFSFIKGEYETRQMFKRSGNMASESLKLGLNSLYGKLAQQAGYRGGHIPTYHQLLWAGQTTAGTRRQLYSAALQRANDIIAFATDAIMSLSSCDLTISTELGDWTYDNFTGITIVQPGVYWLKKGDSWEEKYRGFDRGSLTRWAILECWRNGVDYQAPLTRFVGLGSALMAKDMRKVWRTWPKEPRTLSLTPNGKRQPGPLTCYDACLCDTIPTVNLNVDVISMAYSLAWVEGDKVIPKVNGVSVNILEQEYLDSYA